MMKKSGGPIHRFIEVIERLPSRLQINYYRRQIGLNCIEQPLQAAGSL